MTSFIDDIAVRAARATIEKELPANGAEGRSVSEAKKQLVIYNMKAGMQNIVTVVAIATLALALFSVISLPVAAILLGGSLWARYCFHDNIESSLIEQEQGQRHETLTEKINVLASQAGVILPYNWRAEGHSNLFGTYLFRQSIPDDSLFPKEPIRA